MGPTPNSSVLGRFEIERDDTPVRYGRKVPRKLLALLEILVLRGPHEVSEDVVMDALWPDEEGDAAHRALGISVLRLRRLLGDGEVIHHGGGKLSIDRRRCWVDAWELESVVDRFRLSRPDDTSPEWLDLERALAIYEGPVLPQDGAYAGTAAVRERLRNRYAQGLVTLREHFERCGRSELVNRSGIPGDIPV